MSIFSDALKSFTDESFTLDVGIPHSESEYYSRVKIVKADGELTREGLPNWELVKNKQAELQAEYDSKQYQRDRAEQYPSIQEQLDMQYWDSVNGTTTWKDAIAKVKTDNPKPSE